MADLVERTALEVLVERTTQGEGVLVENDSVENLAVAAAAAGEIKTFAVAGAVKVHVQMGGPASYQ